MTFIGFWHILRFPYAKNSFRCFWVIRPTDRPPPMLCDRITVNDMLLFAHDCRLKLVGRSEMSIKKSFRCDRWPVARVLLKSIAIFDETATEWQHTNNRLFCFENSSNYRHVSSNHPKSHHECKTYVSFGCDRCQRLSFSLRWTKKEKKHYHWCRRRHRRRQCRRRFVGCRR